MNLRDMLLQPVAANEKQSALLVYPRSLVGTASQPAKLYFDVHLSDRKEVLTAFVPVTGDLTDLVVVLRACGETEIADKIESGEIPNFDFNSLANRKVLVSVPDGNLDGIIEHSLRGLLT